MGEVMKNVSVVMPIVRITPEVVEIIKIYISQLKIEDEMIISINKNFIKNFSTLNSFGLDNKKLIIVDSSKFTGVSSARNMALDQIKNEIIVFADDDDIPINNRISTIRDYFMKYDCDIFFSNMDVAISGIKQRVVWGPDNFCWSNMAFKNQITLPSSAISYEVASNTRFDTHINYGEDYFFWLKCFQNNYSNVCFCKESLLIYNYDGTKLKNKYGIYRVFGDVKVRFGFFLHRKNLKAFFKFILGVSVIIPARIIPYSILKKFHIIISPTLKKR
jgi:hypothetical protein